MTRYINWADVTGSYPSIARDRGSEQDALGTIIDQAEGEVDARLAARWTTPFVPGSSNVPQIVRTLAIDITFYRLSMQQDWAGELREYIDARFKALLDGSAALTTSGGLVPPTNQSAAWVSTPYRSSFGIDDPINYSVSESWQEAAEDERSGD